jgi:hypothetical protein
MAIAAGLIKGPFMDFRFCVAVAALDGGILKVWAFMTSRAVHLRMRPYQWKAACLMVEIYQAVFSIVTVYAVIAEILEVLGHKFRIVLGMAIKAGIFLKLVSQHLRIVAGGAAHRRSIVVNSVVDQTEAGFCMVKIAQCCC